MQFQETCPAGAGEQCFSRPASSLTAHPDASRCLEKPKACGRGLFPAGLPSPGLSKLWRKQRGRRAYCKTFAKKYSHTSMCTPVKTLRRTRAWRHPVQAVRGGGSTLTPACPWTWGAGESWLSSWAEPGFLVHVPLHSLHLCRPSPRLRGKHKRSIVCKKVQKQREYKSFGNIRPSVQVHLGNL